MQTVAYFGGAVLLGLVIVYGILHSRFRRPTSNQDAATKRLYEEEEKDRKRREAAASKSSNSTDVVESKTYTTGKDLAVQGAEVNAMDSPRALVEIILARSRQLSCRVFS